MTAVSAVQAADGEGTSPTLTPVLRALIVAAVVAVGTVTYFVITRQTTSARPYNPWLIALLLVGNLIAGSALLVLVGRAVARRRAARLPLGGNGQLHVRLVALFSIAAAVPLILVTITASLLFQYGTEFWSSQRAQSMLENSTAIARGSYDRQVREVAGETRAMSKDLAGYLREMPIDGRLFQEGLLFQTRQRELSEAMIVRLNERDPLIVLNPYARPLRNVVTPAMMRQLKGGASQITFSFADRAAALVPLAYGDDTYLYAARVFDAELARQLDRGNAVLADYRALQSRSRSLQLRVNAGLLAI
jgi:two-component system, NtrC family, nitrogen regulation sensor histidine kinase NtrY